MVKETDQALSCLLWIIVGALALFLIYHGGDLADAVIRAIK
jgi:hypothetical protein